MAGRLWLTGCSNVNPYCSLHGTKGQIEAEKKEKKNQQLKEPMALVSVVHSWCLMH